MADLEIFKGDSKDYNLTIKNSAGVVIDITGYTFYFTVKETYSDTDANAKIDKTVTTHSDPTNGQTVITLNASDSTSLAVSSSTQKYVYDLRMKDTSGKVTTLLNGKFIIRQNVRVTT